MFLWSISEDIAKWLQDIRLLSLRILGTPFSLPLNRRWPAICLMDFGGQTVCQVAELPHQSLAVTSSPSTFSNQYSTATHPSSTPSSFLLIPLRHYPSSLRNGPQKSQSVLLSHYLIF